MNKVTELLHERKVELTKQLAEITAPIMEELRQIRKALEMLEPQDDHFIKHTQFEKDRSKIKGNQNWYPAEAKSAPPQENPNDVMLPYPGTPTPEEELEHYFGNWDNPAPSYVKVVADFKLHNMTGAEDCDETCRGCSICRRGWEYR